MRLGKHFLSWSPMFEVFSTQIYTHSIISNLTFGGARYIATGRGFATVREPFSKLYSRFAGPSIYLGMRTLCLLLYVSLSLWMPHLIYFWITVLALCIAPFLFNPHQFSFADFIIDYREFLRWMSRGNSLSHVNSWIGYCRMSRTMITGYKKKNYQETCPEPNGVMYYSARSSSPFSWLWSMSSRTCSSSRSLIPSPARFGLHLFSVSGSSPSAPSSGMRPSSSSYS